MISLGRIAGIDYGGVRIGVAITDAEQRIASPWETYTRRTSKLDAEHFQELAQDEKVALFVVGLPVHLHGGESQSSNEARKFGKWLGEATGVPVVFFDERFSTSEARRLLLETPLTAKQRKARVDQLAAQVLLTAYLEGRDRAHENLAGLDE